MFFCMNTHFKFDSTCQKIQSIKQWKKLHNIKKHLGEYLSDTQVYVQHWGSYKSINADSGDKEKWFTTQRESTRHFSKFRTIFLCSKTGPWTVDQLKPCIRKVDISLSILHNLVCLVPKYSQWCYKKSWCCTMKTCSCNNCFKTCCWHQI